MEKTAPTGFSTGSNAAWSLAAWAKPEAIDAQDHLIITYGDAGSGSTPHISLASTDQWRVSTWEDDLDANSPLPQLGVWTHLVGTCDGTDLRLYVDGVLAAGPLTVTNAPEDSFWTAGSEITGGGVFRGALDDVRVYNRALSVDEVKALYAQGSSTYQAGQPTLLASGLVGYWPFNGGDISGNSVLDRSGQGNNGTMSGGPLKVIGKIGQALNLDGQNDMATIADHASLDMTSAVTVSTWFYPRDLSGGWHVIAAKGISGTNSNYGLWYTGGYFSITFWNGTWINHATNQTYSAGQWYHLVGIIDSANDNVRLYVNGQLDIDSQTETTNMVANNDPLYITVNYGGAWANGVIDETRVYNRALSADEVKALYNMGR
jgi:hypothetical protein